MRLYDLLFGVFVILATFLALQVFVLSLALWWPWWVTVISFIWLVGGAVMWYGGVKG